MRQSEDVTSEAAVLRERLSALSAASLRINESLDLDTVLQGVLDSARSLSCARYGVLAVLDNRQVEALLASGLTPEEFRGLQEIAGGEGIFEYLGSLKEPLRVADFAGHAHTLGLPEFLPPVQVRAFLAVPILRLGEGIGHIYLAQSEPDREFSAEDEETLVMFASQAALVIANARRHREERQARAGLEALINTSPVGVVVFDVRTATPASFNREATRIADGLRSPDQTLAQLLDTLTIRRADGREEALAKLPLARLMSAGDTVRAEEITLIAQDGRSVSALLNATPVLQEEGEVEFYVVTLQDLTELEELGRLRSDFLGLVSHRLRTPLAAVKGSIATLLEAGSELEPAETRQFYRIIRDESDRMRRLIGDLLDVAHIETGTLSIAPALADVAGLVEEAQRRLLGEGGRRGLEIVSDLPPHLPPIMADGQRMAQALSHLLFYVAARPAGASVIRVSAVREGLHVAITVSAQRRDDASGNLPRRLVRFPLGEVETGDRGGDADLALALCRGIVEAHGGRLREEGDAADLEIRYTITVPAVEWETGRLAATVSPGSHRAVPDRQRVLAIDDDPQALRQVRSALWNAGYAPLITDDPEDALRLIKEEPPHLILLDVTLPGYEGKEPELLRGILRTADAPVILVAAPGQDDLMTNALDLGASDYLVRPFSPAELAARIRAALRRHEAPHLAGPAEPYVLGSLAIDYTRRRVTVAGAVVDLSPTEYAVLAELSAHAGRTLSHDRLLQRVWSPGRKGQPWLVREVMKRLRAKLGDDANNPAFVFTEPRAGYRLGPVEPPEPNIT